MVNEKIGFVLPEALWHEFRERVVQDGYGLRGKSKWVSEAIEALLSMNDYMQLVRYNDEMTGFERTDAIQVDRSLKLKVDEAVLDIRRIFPELKGGQSGIVRTAILQRLLDR